MPVLVTCGECQRDLSDEDVAEHYLRYHPEIWPDRRRIEVRDE